MGTTTTESIPAAAATTATARTKRGIVRAILAGGLVLGVGAAVTLAAWNDSEFASSAFGAGSFDLEGQESLAAGFTDHEAAPGAPLEFGLAPENLSPGDVVYAPFALRLDDATTNDATISIASTGTGVNAANLSYAITTTATFGCDAATVGTALVPALTPTTASPTATFTLAQGAAGAPGAAVNLCLIVTAGTTLAEGAAADVTWEFSAVSVSAN
ncbi:SipW-dependent-type signal peptide-containing protein [Agreia sp. COWG]|uniref:SipW-dependent-type signal peptide-containing protein n=1 Tax=Agreia sp. COWG TaxID=2773266 RepID=UPI0019288B6A|nr:SipW-dependent-type signal peptide-containing protein [Agreia sp. COWG]CAD5992201.1 SipW-cognate class signal peptide [Agreia sp. COWG]